MAREDSLAAISTAEIDAARVFLSASRSIVGIARRKKNSEPRPCATGFLWDSEGTVLANYRTLVNASEFSVFLNDSSTPRANGIEYYPIAADESCDLAVLRPVNPESLFSHSSFAKARPLPKARSSEIREGQPVFCIGNHLERQKTFRSGILQSVGRGRSTLRSLRHNRDMLETSIVDESGSVGGILLNLKGELLGIIPSNRPGFHGPASAVSVHVVKGFLKLALGKRRKAGQTQRNGAHKHQVTTPSPAQVIPVRMSACTANSIIPLSKL
ncbi:hypothetical protein NDN08_006625 [Rhodosorus marinus]|uniref:Trypsin-like peptidase domain-containing protein n=1 Tax=Rhodosorus marinus TaxID=101924 RepID=A0AAV8ULX0_9RHOD|nr:hypothetical protein NDN08_006625 [Rhodosorus marinus]